MGLFHFKKKNKFTKNDFKPLSFEEEKKDQNVLNDLDTNTFESLPDLPEHVSNHDSSLDSLSDLPEHTNGNDGLK